MTIFDIRNALARHFMTSTVFQLLKDSPNFKINDISVEGDQIISHNPEAKVKLIDAALESMEKDEILKGVQLLDGDKIYVLVKPVETFVQSVDISPACADLIYNIITSYRKANNIESDKCDRLGITENDIFNLAVICRKSLERE